MCICHLPPHPRDAWDQLARNWSRQRDLLHAGLQQIILALDNELADLEGVLGVMEVPLPPRPWVLNTPLSAEYAGFREVFRHYFNDSVEWQGRQVYLLLQGLAAAHAALLSAPADFLSQALASLREQAPGHPELLGEDGRWRRL
jgi:hypothetical protein